jgi:hypothetical protein
MQARNNNIFFSFLTMLPWLTLLFLTGCQKKIDWNSFLLPPLTATEKTKINPNPQKKIIVIFVHGTMLGNNPLDEEHHRFLGFYNYQIINKRGLHPIKSEDQQTLGSLIAAENYRRTFQALHQNKNQLYFYTYGWDGALDPQHRLRWGKNFYAEIIHLLKQKKLWGDKNVEIEVHGFSHGGNVVLNLAQAEREFQQQLSINRLCLWGMPVQQETAHLVEDRLFKEVFHFYSRKDKIQIFDIFSTSRRRSYKNFNKFLTHIPQKLHQINIKMNSMHPNHYEFWYLGTTSTAYRKNFPLFPFPLVHFFPLFHELIKKNHPTSSFLSIVGKRKKNQLKLKLKAAFKKQSFFSTLATTSLLCSLDEYGIKNIKAITTHGSIA